MLRRHEPTALALVAGGRADVAGNDQFALVLVPNPDQCTWAEIGLVADLFAAIPELISNLY